MNKMFLIYAADKNWAIGKDNDLLVRIPEDLTERFKALTLNNAVVMGRKTLLSLPGAKGLPKRKNYVLTRNNDFSCENADIVHSLDELFSVLENEQTDIFVIGGGEIYSLLQPYCSGAFVTKIYSEYDADTFVNNLDADPAWEVSKKHGVFTSIAGVDCEYIDYVNNSVKEFSNGK